MQLHHTHTHTHTNSRSCSIYLFAFIFHWMKVKTYQVTVICLLFSFSFRMPPFSIQTNWFLFPFPIIFLSIFFESIFFFFSVTEKKTILSFVCCKKKTFVWHEHNAGINHIMFIQFCLVHSRKPKERERKNIIIISNKTEKCNNRWKKNEIDSNRNIRKGFKFH